MHGSSVVECWICNRESPVLNPPFATISKFGHFCSLHDAPVHSELCINEYLAIDSGGNVSGIVFALNCCMARMLLREVELVSE